MKTPMSLREVHKVRQDDPALRERWFSSKTCDLFVWQRTTDGRIIRFQFCFDKPHDEHIADWSEARGLVLAAVDDGEKRGPLHPKASPLVIPNGETDLDRVARLFEQASTGIDTAIRSFVRERLANQASPK